MSINLGTPKPTELKPRIIVIGVGGAGGNAVNNMINADLEGVEFLACNTDAQALSLTVAPRKVQLGANLTQGLGSGSRPEVGRSAAQEAIDEIMDHIAGSHMAFVTAGMGGGTGTGAAPVIAQLAREAGVLTVGVVTKPFSFEGAHRMAIAEAGIQELQGFVDTLLVIPNQNLFRVANEKTTFADAFKMADDVLHAGVRGVTDLMVMPGLINLDFADVKAVMEEMGKAMMGTGQAEGEKRALTAAEAAISNPLLEDTSMAGARGILINITGGADMTLFEVDEAVNRIKDEVDPKANIIFGSTFDERLEGAMRVSIVATGIDAAVDSVRPPRLEVVRAVSAPPSAPAFVAPAERSAEPQIGIPARAFEMERPQTRMESEPAASPVFAAPATSTVAQATIRAGAGPGPQAGSEPRQALRTTSSAQLEPDPFIAPPPMEAKVAPARTAPDPFAEAAVANGGIGSRRAGPSLLERMTGLG
ncbi:MAG: cell division protein FtsZ, partial [Proteobacteria bacterium]|nr:cell division protein FtsZ [Pseudomonadota bacterium]